MTLTQVINNATIVVVFATPTAIVLFAFLWNLAMLIFQSGAAEKVKQARARIFWAIVGMFVVFSLAGIVAILQTTLFGSEQNNQQRFIPPPDSRSTGSNQPRTAEPIRSGTPIPNPNGCERLSTGELVCDS